MAKLGKEMENRLTVSKKVIAAAQTHGPALAPILADKALAAKGDGDTPKAAAFKAMFASLAAMLTSASNALETAELNHSAEQADDVGPRTARDKAKEQLLALMVKLGSTVEDALGADGLKAYGLEGDTPRTPKTLATYVGNVIHLMTQTPKQVTTDVGGTFSTAATVKILQKAKAELDAALADVDREARELEETLGTRDQALSEWADVYQGVANTLTGLFRLAGRRDLAERVRPTSRAVTGEDTGTTEDAGPAGESEPEGGKGTP